MDRENILRRSIKIIMSMSQIQDSESVIKLCVMALDPDGEENPKELIRSLSNRTIDKIASYHNSAHQDVIVGPISRLIVLEWCYRYGYLYDDWTWEWSTIRDGEAKYRPKVDMDDITLILDRSC